MNGRSEPDAGALHARLQIDTPLGPFLGAQRIALLEAIARHGSIARAAKAVPLSYKAAWEAVEDMNNLAEQPLVERVAGGPRGGGTTLTERGHRLIAFYRALEQEHEAAVQRLALALKDGQADDVAGFRRLLRRFSVQSSARNQYAGVVQAIARDPVECGLSVAIGPGLVLAAVVTADSVERLRLRVGSEVVALVKSSSVMLASGPADSLSARNRLPGRVLRLQRGNVNSEVTLQLGDGPLQLTSVITDDSVQRLGLQAGSAVTAFFKASSVVLLALD
jgi:molybdate transport system regulatory protein